MRRVVGSLALASVVLQIASLEAWVGVAFESASSPSIRGVGWRRSSYTTMKGSVNRMTMRRVRNGVSAVLVVGVLAVVAAACGGNAGSGGNGGGSPASNAAPVSPASSAGSGGIPQNNGGDADADNNGGPSDGDGGQ